jgi:hypothetical protein
MSINTDPTGIYPGYEYTGDASSGLPSKAGVFIPLSDIPNLDATEAQNDYRKLLWGLIDQAESAISSLDASEQPKKMQASKSSLTVLDDDSARKSYTFVFNYEISNLDIEAE